MVTWGSPICKSLEQHPLVIPRSLEVRRRPRIHPYLQADPQSSQASWKLPRGFVARRDPRACVVFDVTRNMAQLDSIGLLQGTKKKGKLHGVTVVSRFTELLDVTIFHSPKRIID